MAQLDAIEIRKLFLGLPVLRENRPLHAVRNASDTFLTEVFLQHVVAMSESAYDRRILAQMLQQGRPLPPELKSSDAVVADPARRSLGRELYVVARRGREPAPASVARAMDRVTNRLWFRVTSVMLVIHAVLLPLLFFGLLFIVQRSHADIFIDQVRTYGRLLADEFELGDALAEPLRTRTLLDSIILSGQGVYAEIVENHHSLRSSLGTTAIQTLSGR